MSTGTEKMSSQRPHTDFVFVDMDDPARYKRIKVQRACNFCRKRKTKCDIGVPHCSNCVKMGINCEFSDPTPKKSSTPEYDDDLLGQGGSQSDADLAKSRRDRTRSRSSSVSSVSTYTFMDPHQAQEMLKELSEFIGPLRISENGQTEYTAVSSEIDGQAQDLQLEIDAQYLAAATQTPTDLPSVDIEAFLYDTYFREVHPYYPILSRRTFYSQLDDERAKPSLMLRNAVMAVAAAFTDDPRLVEYVGPEGLQGYYFYERARTLFDLQTDTPRLSTLQTLLLLVKYQEIAKRKGFYSSLLYFSMCVRFSDWLELHREHPKYATDKVTAEISRRVFWVIYILDRLTSTAAGRRFAIEEKYIDVSQPTFLDEENNKDDQRIVTHLIESIKLVQLNSVVVRHLHASAANQTVASSSLSTIEDRLSQWYEELSAPIRLDGNGEEASAAYTIPNSSHLQLLYEANRILLHRACLSNPVDGVAHMDICTQSALNITRLASDTLNEMTITGFLRPIRGVYTPVYCLVLAIQVYLINIASGDRPTVNMAKDRFPKTLVILRELAVHTAIPELCDSVQRLEAAFSNRTLLSKMEQLQSTYASNRPFPATSLASTETVSRKQRKRTSPPASKGPAKRPNTGSRQGSQRTVSTPQLNLQPSHFSAPEPTSQRVTIPPFQTLHLLFPPHDDLPNPPSPGAKYYETSPMVTAAYQYPVSTEEFEYEARMLYDQTAAWADAGNSIATAMPQAFGKPVSSGIDSRAFAPRILTHEGEDGEESDGLDGNIEQWSWKAKQG